MSSQLDVVQNGHSLEKLNILKGSGYTPLGNGVGGDPGNVFSFMNHLTSLRIIESADAIQEAGLTSPIGADNGKDLTQQ
jgi:hypothetical protein